MSGDRLGLFIGVRGGATSRHHVPLLVRLSKSDLVKALTAEKAIEGQQEFSGKIGSGDPMYAHHEHLATQGPHIEAAKHYIQHEFHSRRPGGQQQAAFHKQKFDSLVAQGATPRAEHFKQAMSELQPAFKHASLYIRKELCK